MVSFAVPLDGPVGGPIDVVVYVLTALAAVVVALTRLRLRREGGAGRLQVGSGLLTVHTVAGGLALVTWLVYLVVGDDTAVDGPLVGILALALWWITAVAGLLVLVRWLPSRGRHATQAKEDRWSRGPALSLLAHLGMLGAVVVFTYAYAQSLV